MLGINNVSLETDFTANQVAFDARNRRSGASVERFYADGTFGHFECKWSFEMALGKVLVFSIF